MKNGKIIINIHKTIFNQKKLFHLILVKKLEIIFHKIAQTLEYKSRKAASLGNLSNSKTEYSTAFCETTVETDQMKLDEIIIKEKFLKIYFNSGKKLFKAVFSL